MIEDNNRVFKEDGSADLVHHQLQFVKSQDPIAGIYGLSQSLGIAFPRVDS